MHKSIPVVMTGLSAAGALTGPATAIASSSHTYRGQGSSMRWGIIQVTIKVSGRRMTAISVSYPADRARSAQINSSAVPALKREALRRQTYQIHILSGATLTSRSFENSLYSAMHYARLA